MSDYDPFLLDRPGVQEAIRLASEYRAHLHRYGLEREQICGVKLVDGLAAKMAEPTSVPLCDGDLHNWDLDTMRCTKCGCGLASAIVRAATMPNPYGSIDTKPEYKRWEEATEHKRKLWRAVHSAVTKP